MTEIDKRHCLKGGDDMTGHVTAVEIETEDRDVRIEWGVGLDGSRLRLLTRPSVGELWGRIGRAAAVAFLILSQAGCCHSHLSTRPDPPTLSSVVGAYLGQMNDGPKTYCRLVLRHDKTGLFAKHSSWTDRDTPMFEVSEWTLDGWDVAISFRTSDGKQASTTLELTGKAYGSSLELRAKIRKYDDAWDRFHLRMVRESHQEDAFATLKRRMHEYEARKRTEIPTDE